MSAVHPAPPLETPSKRLTIALAGNPNAGKTTLFNALTGLNYKVANYPGVTVERRQGKINNIAGKNIFLLDLPGIYGLTGKAPDEQIAVQTLTGTLSGEAPPDAVICVVDASNLERNLLLASQVIDLGLPTVIALTMVDTTARRGLSVKSELLSKSLGVPVVQICVRQGKGLEELRSTLSSAIENRLVPKQRHAWREGAAANFFEAPTWQDTDAETEARYRWISKVVSSCSSQQNTPARRRSDAIDSVLLHRVWGVLIFVALMAIIFQSIFTWASAPMELIDGLFTWISAELRPRLPDNGLRSLIVDGVIPGVGSVLIFVPQIAILYFFIGLLEDSGYLCRAAFLMDRLMRPFGLQGRSFIPLLSSFACAIPGIMATRTIPSIADRLTTIMVAPLMSCSARLPVYALLISAFVPATTLWGLVSVQGLVLLGLYVLGIVAAAAAALCLRSTLLRGKPSHFVMEMPSYHIPALRNVLRNVRDRIFLFVRDAGTVILACSVVLWFLASHPVNPELNRAEQLEQSYAGQLGQLIEPAIEPLGFDWKIGISLLASFAAREVFVSSMATVYNLEDADESSATLISSLHSSGYGLLTAISLMVFFAFACQCMSTLAVCKRETGGWRWPALMFIYMSLLAYVSSLLVFQLGSYWIGTI